MQNRTTQKMAPTKDMITAYEDGKRIGNMHDCPDYVAQDAMCYGPAVVHAFYRAGALGRDMPAWVNGYRYGDVPACGYSRNYRDDCLERGVSVMCVGDEQRDQTDGTFALFNTDRPLIRVCGWLIGDKGSDGEPLLIGARLGA